MLLWIAVAIGGSLGAMSRYAVSQMFLSVPGKLPYATLTVNILGSFLMGMFFVLILHKGILPAVWRQVVMVGFLGAFTTFSAFSIEAVELIHVGQWQVALLYALISVVACIGAAALGYYLTNTVF
ncbi:Putative fluoride ion transporter CrcB [Thalassocella blandensis]|nr:Putative fluoride ion transporter CrcB [Thalassocella blandensis]